MLESQDKKDILNRYDERIGRFGPTIKSLAIGPEERQEIRYRVLSEVGIRSGDHVVDVGCGLASYYHYLNSAFQNISYTGVDINSNYIDVCKSLFPESNFNLGELQEFSQLTCDYVVSSSSFNIKLKQSNYEYIDEFICDAFKKAKKGIAIDFLSIYAESKFSDIFYYDPGVILQIAKRYTNRVCIRHDYPLFEFALYMYPEYKGWH